MQQNGHWKAFDNVKNSLPNIIMATCLPQSILSTRSSSRAFSNLKVKMSLALSASSNDFLQKRESAVFALSPNSNLKTWWFFACLVNDSYSWESQCVISLRSFLFRDLGSVVPRYVEVSWLSSQISQLAEGIARLTVWATSRAWFVTTPNTGSAPSSIHHTLGERAWSQASLAWLFHFLPSKLC